MKFLLLLASLLLASPAMAQTSIGMSNTADQVAGIADLIDVTDATTDQTSGVLNVPRWARGIAVYLNLTAFTTAASLDINVEARYGNRWARLADCGLTIDANANYLCVVHPGGGTFEFPASEFDGTEALRNVSALPTQIRIVADHLNANVHTYTVDVAWLR